MAKANLFFGASGPEVIKLQKLLNKAGFKVKVDGQYQLPTERAVEAFQKSLNGAVKVDQVAGPKTMKALQAAASGKGGGGAKLKMTVPDYSKQAKLYDSLDGMQRIQGLRDQLNDLETSRKKIDDFVKQSYKTVNGYQNPYTSLIDELSAQIGHIDQQQQDFAKHNGKDEAKAKKALEEAQLVHKEIAPQMKKLTKMESEMRALEKQIAGLSSALGKLT